jgi:1,4-dihydroxy-2-naphthoate octaprenyltransferase
MNVKPNSAKAWLLATRPRTLTASITPVVVGSSLAYNYGYFKIIPSLICLVFAIISQIISNFANDYYDYKKGTDDEARIGPKRAVSAGWIAPRKMLFVTLALLGLDMLLGISLIYYGGWWLIAIGAFIGIFALAYSGGPYPLAYYGFGDICVLFFFGIIPVGFTYFVQANNWTLDVTISGISTGLVVINILVANNFRDRNTDALSNKRTSIVIFGEKFGIYFYLLNGVIAVIGSFIVAFNTAKFLPIMMVIFLALHLQTWGIMKKIGSGSGLIKVLGMSARNAIIFGLIFALGMIIGK